MSTRVDYKFIRLKITNEAAITQTLNGFAVDGWRVVSHTEQDGEYSFVLWRPR